MMLKKIKKVVDSNPNKIAYKINNDSITYKDLWNKAEYYSNLLRRQGSSPIIIYGNNSINVVVSILASIMANRAYVPINLSTPYTKNSKRVNELINDFKNEDETIYNISGENLANLIELDKKEEIEELLNRLLFNYKDTCDALILGCTHYSLIKDEFKKVLPNTILLDGVVGVTKEVRRQLTNNNLLNDRLEKGTIKIINSKSEDLIKRSYEILKM